MGFLPGLWLRRAAIASILASAGAAHTQIIISGPEVGAEIHGVDAREDGVKRPQMALREVAEFLFDERGDLPIPPFWRAAQDSPPLRERPGFPVWNIPYHDFTVAASGLGSAALPIRGGSTALRTRPGTIPVLRGADFRLSAQVRTLGLRHARAAISMRLLDEAMEPIPGAFSISPLVQSEGAWTTISTDLLGEWPSAAYLELELLALQPDTAPDAPDEDTRAYWEQDIEGVAWFDEVRVVQLPRVELRSEAPVGWFRSVDGAIELSSLVRDLTGERLMGELLVYDARGRLADSQRRIIRRDVDVQSWKPKVGAPGWYRAILQIEGDGVVLMRRGLDFLVSGSPLDAAVNDRFGVEVVGAPLHRVEDLALAMGGWPVGRLVLVGSTLARDDFSRANLADKMIGLTNSLMDRRQHLEWVFTDESHGSEIFRMRRAATERGALWSQTMAPLLDRLGARVGVWGVGSVRSPAMRGSLDTFDGAMIELLREFVPTPTVRTPWNLSVPLPPDAPGVRRAVTIPPGTGAAQLDLFAQAAIDARASAGAIEMIFEMPGIDDFGGLDQIATLIPSVIKASWAFESRGMERPFMTLRGALDWGTRVFESAGVAPGLAGWLELSRVMHNRRISGVFDIDGKVMAALFEPARGQTGEAAMVFWSITGRDEPVEIRLASGAVRLRDPFGQQRALHPIDIGARRLHRLVTPPEGVIVEGVDSGLILLQRSLRIEPERMIATGRLGDMTLSWSSGWDSTIEGVFSVVEPPQQTVATPGWDINPRTGRFRLDPRGSFSIPLGTSFSPLTEVREQTVEVELEMIARREIGVLPLKGNVVVGSGAFDVELIVMASPGLDGDDAMIEVVVTNPGDEMLDLSLTLHPGGGIASRESFIGGLEPGKGAARSFEFPGAMPRLRGEIISVTVLDQTTGERINRLVKAP